MNISDKGIALIKNFEGCKLMPYVCPAGKLTIGIGHVIRDGEIYSSITVDEAQRIFMRDIMPVEDAINKYVKVPITQCEFDALCSFAFNLGVGALMGSTLLICLNESDYRSAADQFLIWNKCHGKDGKLAVSKGLTLRRMAERDMFLGC